MSSKKSRGAGDDSEDLTRPPPLQAILLADSFTFKFRPITLERPKVLLPLVNMPMIEYTLTWLETAGVEDVFVFCCSHAHQVKEYLDKAGWTGKTAAGSMSVSAVESHDAISAGDALRVMYDRGVIHGDFVLISGDTISNMSLKEALQEHKDRRKKDPLAVMTMIIKHSKPDILTNETRLGNDEIAMAINPETKELHYYEDRLDSSRSYVTIDKDILSSNPSLVLHNDMEDCYIDICSSEVLSLFTDNFDYQHLRRHFVKGLLVDDIMGYKIYTHEIHSSYAARIDNFRSYDTVSKDIIQRWTYPLVPDVLSFGNSLDIKLHRQGIYKASDVILSHSAQIGANSVVGSATNIGDHCKISNSVIGEGCKIEKNVVINGSYIWDNVIIEDGCKVNYSLICDGVHLRAGAVVEFGSILSFKVEVGKNVTIPAHSKVSLLPQPSNEDSDEELEYADTSSGVTDSPSLSSTRSNGDQVTAPSEEEDSGTSDETGTSGVVGYIWTSGDSGVLEEWRQSIAPIPKEKLEEMRHACSAGDDDGSEGELNNPTVPDSDNESADAIDDEDDPFAKFEKEVEETFQRALNGVSQDNLILEINGLRLSYSLQHADCAGAVFYSVMKSALVAAQSTNGRLGDFRMRRCQTCFGPVLASRSPGLGNVDNLKESSSLPRNWDFSNEANDDREVLIECKDVHKSFGDKHVLRGVSFKIRHGEAVGIIGPSGTGKSTILKVMAGLLAPDKGDVIICGRKRHGLVSDEDISGLRIGLVFQSAALFDSLTVRENVGFLLYENSSLPEDRISKLVTETLAAVGLKGVEDRMPSELSGGMKKRVALARSIIFDDTKEEIEPEVLLYDEPTAGLDPIASTVVEDLIRSVHMIGRDALGKPGKITSYVVVTHQHSTIRRAVDRLLFLHEGKVVWEGMTHEFMTSTNPIVQQFASGSLDGPIQYF